VGENPEARFVPAWGRGEEFDDVVEACRADPESVGAAVKLVVSEIEGVREPGPGVDLVGG
jgi:hypothetical protein